MHVRNKERAPKAKYMNNELQLVLLLSENYNGDLVIKDYRVLL